MRAMRSFPSLTTKSLALFVSVALVSPNARGLNMLSNASPMNIAEKRPMLLAHFGSFGVPYYPRGTSKGTVIHILDVHSDVEAQKNIGETIRLLFEQKRASMLALEGAFSPLDFRAFRLFPHQDAVAQAAGNLLRQNRISGGVYAALTSAAVKRVVGVDDAAHYQANVDAVRRSFASLPSIERTLAARARACESDKRKVFNGRLATFDAIAESFHAGELPIETYLEVLSRLCESMPRHAQLFLAACRMEETFDSKKLERDRAELLADPQLDLSKFPDLQRYLDYSVALKSVNAETLTEAMDRMERAAYERLIQSERERRLVDRTRKIRRAEKLIHFEFTSADWREFATNNGSPSPFLDFYREARIRDGKIAENLLKNLSPGIDAVLVTGGFHAKGVDRRLCDAGYTVIPFIPRVSAEGAKKSTSYLKVFAEMRNVFLSDLAWSPEKILETGLTASAVEADRHPTSDWKTPLSHIARTAGIRMIAAFSFFGSIVSVTYKAGRGLLISLASGERSHHMFLPSLPEAGDVPFVGWLDADSSNEILDALTDADSPADFIGGLFARGARVVTMEATAGADGRMTEEFVQEMERLSDQFGSDSLRFVIPTSNLAIAHYNRSGRLPMILSNGENDVVTASRFARLEQAGDVVFIPIDARPGDAALEFQAQAVEKILKDENARVIIISNGFSYSKKHLYSSEASVPSVGQLLAKRFGNAYVKFLVEMYEEDFSVQVFGERRRFGGSIAFGFDGPMRALASLRFHSDFNQTFSEVWDGLIIRRQRDDGGGRDRRPRTGRPRSPRNRQLAYTALSLMPLNLLENDVRSWPLWVSFAAAIGIWRLASMMVGEPLWVRDETRTRLTSVRYVRGDELDAHARAVANISMKAWQKSSQFPDYFTFVLTCLEKNDADLQYARFVLSENGNVLAYYLPGVVEVDPNHRRRDIAVGLALNVFKELIAAGEKFVTTGSLHIGMARALMSVFPKETVDGVERLKGMGRYSRATFSADEVRVAGAVHAARLAALENSGESNQEQKIKKLIDRDRSIKSNLWGLEQSAHRLRWKLQTIFKFAVEELRRPEGRLLKDEVVAVFAKYEREIISLAPEIRLIEMARHLLRGDDDTYVKFCLFGTMDCGLCNIVTDIFFDAHLQTQHQGRFDAIRASVDLYDARDIFHWWIYFQALENPGDQKTTMYSLDFTGEQMKRDRSPTRAGVIIAKGMEYYHCMKDIVFERQRKGTDENRRKHENMENADKEFSRLQRWLFREPTMTPINLNGPSRAAHAAAEAA